MTTDTPLAAFTSIATLRTMSDRFFATPQLIANLLRTAGRNLIEWQPLFLGSSATVSINHHREITSINIKICNLALVLKRISFKLEYDLHGLVSISSA
ncbi:hypothetical protein [Mobiluncus mulieris]|uniref:hypothetical protein n=1 Tax=Mobiluncus mulieris TaxID=2052 RepID=UPI0024326F63|nr:hypothetical protein [Mobiluncus mulieris]